MLLLRSKSRYVKYVDAQIRIVPKRRAARAAALGKP
jgi:hypothetical protein